MRCLPNSFTTSAPPTLKRSAIVLFIDAFSCIDSRVSFCSFGPMRFAGMMKNGSTIRVSSVRRHSSASMKLSVTTTAIRLENTVPSVLVTACCAPITSLFMRDMSAPVCVRVKKESGWRWMWSNERVRMSKIRPSPIFAEYHRCASCEHGVHQREADCGHRQRAHQRAVLLGDRGVEQGPQDQRRDRADDRGARTTVITKPTSLAR